jgi:hypothetical protein
MPIAKEFTIRQEDKSDHHIRIRKVNQLSPKPLGGVCSFALDRLSAHKINRRHADNAGLL